MSETLHTAHLIARHAESALWLARYMERVENVARLLDVTNTFARDADDTRNWMSILRINGDLELFYKKHAEANQGTVGQFYLLDADNPTSVQTAIAADQRLPRPHPGTDAGRCRAGSFHRHVLDAERGYPGAYRNHRGHVLS
jgi:hypothetical protein